MPQFNAYPAIVELLAADLLLVYKSDVGAVKTITVENFAAEIKRLTSKAFFVNVINTDTTLDQTFQFVVGNSGAGFNVTLPVSSENEGIPYYISNKGTGAMSILPNGTDTIEGAASLSLGQYVSVLIVSDGLGMWHVFGIPN